MPSNVGRVEDAVRQAGHVQPKPVQSERSAVEKPLQGAGGVVETASHQEVQGKAVSGRQPPWELSSQETERLMENINQILDIFDIEARILVDRQTNMKIIQLRDNTTQKLIRQVPSEEFLSRVIQARDLIGLLIDQIV